MATVIKRFMACTALYPLLKRKWTMIAMIVLTGTAVCVLTILVFGPSSFISFFTDRRLASTPNIAYLEWPNQSLLATVLRMTKYEFVFPQQYLHPLFITGALVLTATTVWIAYRLRSEHAQSTVALSLLLGLLLFPYTASHYSLVAIVPLLFLYRACTRATHLQRWKMTLPWTLDVLCMIFDVAAFFANLAIWCALIGLCLMELQSNGTDRRVAIVSEP